MSAIGGHHSAKSGTDVWLTPPHVLRALGEFDLDPCSPIGRPWDTAKQHLTIEDDGLAHEWNGRVWMNPPYANGIIGTWLSKMADHGMGTALTFARTETAVFFRHIWERADALLFLEGRLTFHYPDGSKAGANGGAPSVLAAYGPSDAEILSSCGLPGAFIPLRLRMLTFGFETVGTWIDEVLRIVNEAGGTARLEDLYRALSASPKAKRNPNWKAKIRQTLQRGPFDRIGDGLWATASK